MASSSNTTSNRRPSTTTITTTTTTTTTNPNWTRLSSQFTPSRLQPSPLLNSWTSATPTPNSSSNGRLRVPKMHYPHHRHLLKTAFHNNNNAHNNNNNNDSSNSNEGKRQYRNGVVDALDAETELLHAVDFGDVSLVKRLLEQHPDVDVDCTDGLGRTPLRLAVKHENKDLVEILLGLSSPNNIYESLLQAIDAGFTVIAETTLRHPRYTHVLDMRRRMGDTDGFFKPEHGSQFPSYVTPLSLAAQKEQFVIVKLLLQRGETIERPHKFLCSCQECINKNKFDVLRMAKCRLDAYRGLASEAYISLNFQDPILIAMELAEELKKQSGNELYFKLEYNELVDRLSSYMVKLLDRVWTHQELDIVLDKTGTPWEDRFENLARLQMALDYQQKKFVAHPNCQQRIDQKWYKGTSKFSTAGWNKKLIIIVMSFLAFPFAVVVFLVKPKSKFARFLALPTVKFIGHALSYFILLALIIYSCKETETRISSSNTLRTVYPSLHTRYTLYRNRTRRFACGHDFPLRMNNPTVTEVMLNIWIVALIAQECQELWKSGLLSHVQNYYNFMDFLLLSVYTATFTLGHLVMRRVVSAVEYLEMEHDYSKDPDLTDSHIYWLNADRRFWHMTDPINMKEGLFAMANILSFTRITYLLPANEILGPLQISLGRMVNDVFQFLSMSAIVIAGFMISLRNLFWYYASRRDIELDPDKIEDPPALAYYGSDKATFRTVFWAIFGRGGTKSVSLGGYNNTVTEHIGQTIDGLYHITMIILMLNVFIAMMTRSYEQIALLGGYNNIVTEHIGQTIDGLCHITMIILMLNVFIAMMTRSYEQIAADEDVEWKFARSSLYMDYISKGRLLPVPLNILEILHHAIRNCFRGIQGFRPFQHPIQKMRKSYSERRRPAIFATKSTRDKIKRIVAADDFAEMGTINRQPSTTARPNGTGHRKSRALSARNTLYQEVVQRIVHRYIMDVQRQTEDRGTADEIRGAFDTMKCEVFTSSRRKDENLCIATEALNNTALDLGKMADGDLDTNELETMCALLYWWHGDTSGSVFGDFAEKTNASGNEGGDVSNDLSGVDILISNCSDDGDDNPVGSFGSKGAGVVQSVEAEVECSFGENESLRMKSVDLEIVKDGVVRLGDGTGSSFGDGCVVRESDDSILRCDDDDDDDNDNEHDDNDDKDDKDEYDVYGTAGAATAADDDDVEKEHVDAGNDGDGDDDDDDDDGGILDDIVDYIMSGDDEEVEDGATAAGTEDKDEMKDGKRRIRTIEGISRDGDGEGAENARSLDEADIERAKHCGDEKY